MSEVLEKIRSRGYWKMIIRPGTFVEKRIENLPSLYYLLLRTSVEERGLGFPNLGSDITVQWHEDWISQEFDWEQYLETWRFFQSGQFVDLRGMNEDWRDKSLLLTQRPNWAPGQFLGVEDIVDQYTEVFEFASRLAFTGAGDEEMHLKISIHGIKGRRLAARTFPEGDSYFKTLGPAVIDDLLYKVDLPKAELVSKPRELALEPAAKLLHRFGWKPSVNALRDIQSELFQVHPFATR